MAYKSDTKGRMTTGSQYVCSICSARFWRRVKYIEHVEVHKNQTNNTEDLHPINAYYQCAICDERTFLETAFLSHVLSHDPIPSRTVSNRSISDNQISSNGILHKNMISNSYFNCYHCPAKFSQEKEFRQHLYEHTFREFDKDSPVPNIFSNGASYSPINDCITSTTADTEQLTSTPVSFSTEYDCDQSFSQDNRIDKDFPETPVNNGSNDSQTSASSESQTSSHSESQMSTSSESQTSAVDEKIVPEHTGKESEKERKSLFPGQSLATLLRLFNEKFAERWEFTYEGKNVSIEEFCSRTYKTDDGGGYSSVECRQNIIRTRSGRIVKPKKLFENESRLEQKCRKSKKIYKKLSLSKIKETDHKKSTPNFKQNSSAEIDLNQCSDINPSNASELCARFEDDLLNVPVSSEELMITENDCQPSTAANNIQKPKCTLLADYESILPGTSINLSVYGNEYIYIGPEPDSNEIKEALDLVKAESLKNDSGIKASNSSPSTSSDNKTSTDVSDLERPYLTIKAQANMPDPLLVATQLNDINEKCCQNKSINSKAAMNKNKVRGKIFIESKDGILGSSIVRNFQFIKISKECMKRLQKQTTELQILQALKLETEKELLSTLEDLEVNDMGDPSQHFNSQLDDATLISNTGGLDKIPTNDGCMIKEKEIGDGNKKLDSVSLPEYGKLPKFQAKQKGEEQKTVKCESMKVKTELCQAVLSQGGNKRTYSKRKFVQSTASDRENTIQYNAAKEIVNIELNLHYSCNKDSTENGSVKEKDPYSDVSITTDDTTTIGCPCNSEDCDLSKKCKKFISE